MIVTYEGPAARGRVDGLLFPRGVPVEVDDALLDRFSSLEGYTVEMADEPDTDHETGDDDNEMEVMHDGDGSL